MDQLAQDLYLFPASFAQRQIWFVDNFMGASAIYTIAGALTLSGPLRVDLLEAALDQVSAHHETLRTRIVEQDGEPRQLIDSTQRIPLSLHKLEHVVETERCKLAGVMLSEMARIPFDLARGPLCRVDLLRMKEHDHILMLSIHHVIADGISLGIMLRDLFDAYNAACDGWGAPLPESTIGFADFAVWEQDQADGDGLSLDSARDHLRDLPVLRLPTDHARPKIFTHRGADLSFPIPDSLGAAVQSTARKNGTTPFTILLTAYAALLARLSGQGDFSIGIPFANRLLEETRDLIGPFANVVPLRIRMEPGASGLDAIAMVRGELSRAQSVQQVPFSRLLETDGAARDTSYPPLFQAWFSLRPPMAPLRLKDLKVAPRPIPSTTAKWDLNFELIPQGEGFEVLVEWATDLFERQTVAHWGDLYLQCLTDLCVTPEQPVARLANQEVSPHQARLWFVDRFENGVLYPAAPTYYNMSAWTQLPFGAGPEDVAQTLAQISARHPILRTCFDTEADLPISTLGDSTDTVPVPVAHRKEVADIARTLAEETQRPFDLSKAPLCRAVLLEPSVGEPVLLLVAHHIIVDGVSLHQLISEIRQLLAGKTLPDIDSKPRAAPTDKPSDISYWREALAGLKPLVLPTDHPRPAVHTFAAAKAARSLKLETVVALERIAVDRGLDLSDLLRAAFVGSLALLSGQKDIVHGETLAPSKPGVLGAYTNLVTLRSNLETCRSLAALAARCRTLRQAAETHGTTPFDRVVLALKPDNDMSRTALFDVLFDYVTTEDTDGIYETGFGWGKYDLTLGWRHTKTGLAANLIYNLDLFDRASGERFADLLIRAVEAFAEDIDRPPHVLGLATSAEIAETRDRLTALKARTASGTIIARFDAMVAECAEAIAISEGSFQITYSQLSKAANAVSERLKAAGVGRGDRVGLLISAGADFMACCLGTVRLGAAYVPIDPTYPQDRIDILCEDADLAVLCVAEGETGSFDLPVMPLPEMETLVATGPERPPETWAQPEDPAYMIFTSGSTGRPKGVVIRQDSVINLLFMRDLPFQFGRGDVWTLFHSPSFDFSVWEMYGPLLNGGRLVVVPPEARLDPARFLDLLVAEGVTVLNQTPAAFYGLAQEAVRAAVDNLMLEVVIFGGEALQPARLKDWCRRFPDIRLVNMYGITETTVHVTHCDVSPRDIADGVSVIGQALPGYGAVLVDEQLRPVTDGVPGEVCITGPGVAVGYFGHKELTEQRFCSLPDFPGHRFFRSGDWVRRAADGRLVYVGRIDQQVKVRGFRIELGEIETALMNMPGIQAAVVLPDGVGNDVDGLAAYFVAQTSVTRSALVGHLLKSLPTYLHPSRYFQLKAIPVTANGKTDTRALREVSQTQSALGESTATMEKAQPQAGVTNAVLGELWRELLKRETVGAEDNFFEIGGHSLLACRLVARIRDRLNVRIPVRTVFECPTLIGLSSEVDQLLSGCAPGEEPMIPRIERHNALPLAPAQLGMWFLHKLDPNSASYNMLTVARMDGALRVALWEQVVEEIQTRHETLRTRFHDVDGRPVQLVSPGAPSKLEVIDLTHLPRDTREAEAKRRIIERGQTPFVLEVAPLMRVMLVKLDEDSHLLGFALHHIIADGWSLGVLLRDMLSMYHSLDNQSPVALPPLPIGYPDYTAWQIGRLTDQRRTNLLRYWRTRLDGVAPLELPTDRPRSPEGTAQGKEISFTIPDALMARVQKIAAAAEATPYVVLLAAFQALLSHFTGQYDIAVGTPVANRDHPDIQDVVGCFVNVVVIRTDLSDRPDFHALVDRVRLLTREADQHSELPFSQLTDALRPDRDPDRPALFQVLFSHIVDFDPPQSLPSLKIEPVSLDVGTAQYDLSLYVDETGDGVTARLVYRLDLFEEQTIQRLRERLLLLLQKATAQPDLPIAKLDILTEAERTDLARWNETARDYQAPETLAALLRTQAAQTPEALALESADALYSYGELQRRVDELAALLQSRGVGPDVPVGICLERSADMVTAILAVIAAGGAYMPMDPDLPTKRLEAICAIAKPRLVVTWRRFASQLPDDAALLCLDANETLAELDAAPPLRPCAAGGDDLAYIIFTSGSTGEPKGVMVPHRGIVNRLLWMQEAYGLTTSDRILQKTPFSFDVSVWEFFWPLMIGARLVLAKPGGHKDPEYLCRLISQSGITTIHFVPSMLSLFLTVADAQSCRSLRRVFASGEALAPSQVQRFLELGLDARLYNLYGPTEASVDVTAWTCSAEDRDRVPIGRPIANTQLHVLDPEGHPLPAGIPGELFIGGIGVARGYYGRPELTKSRFVVDPFREDAGATLFKTGDRARWNSDGALEYLGRLDDQVKLRGFRVELGEIEAVLRSHPSVHEAAVALWGKSERAGQLLHAYLVAEVAGETLSLDEVRDFIGARLPSYMIPSGFTVLDALPLSPNGKIDRRRLPEPDQSDKRSGSRTPISPMELRIAAIWEKVLDQPVRDITKNFFDVGGNSLLLVRLGTLLRQSVAPDLSLVDLFRFPSIDALADHLDRREEQQQARRKGSLPVGHGVRPGSSEIALIGMSGRFPGAPDIESFWRNLCDGVDAVTSLDRDTLLAAGVPESIVDDPHYVAKAATLADVDLFDAEFFGYAPKDAIYLDPQGRLFLECAHEALERAGCVPERQNLRVGVFAGSGFSTYGLALRDQVQSVGGTGEAIQMLIGSDKDYLASRTAYKLGLNGPAVGVQTACSTSLVAVHLACRALQDRDCDAALAGGSSITVPHHVGYLQEEGSITSPVGICRTFDEAADGTVPGNGVGVVLLKRLDDALADGDHIHGVIRASAINNDGADKVGYTAPSLQGQAAVIGAVHDKMNCGSETIGYVEAHGTGTPLGDMVEIAALKTAFARSGLPESCAIGSLKSNMGHLDAAAGVAGLMKAALAVETGRLPPSLHYSKSNPLHELEESPFRVNTRLRRWDSERGPRRAAVSSFGIGGTNAHLVVEEPPARTFTAVSEPQHLLVVTARTEAALQRQCEQLADHLQDHSDLDLRDVAHTLLQGRRHHMLRHGIIVRDKEEAVAKLRAGPIRHTASTETAKRRIWDFGTVPVAHAVPRRFLERTIASLPSAQAEAILAADPNASRLTRFIHRHATALMWEEAGHLPDAVTGAGPSLLDAACFAGLIQLEDAVRIATLLADGDEAAATRVGSLRRAVPRLPILDPLTARELPAGAANWPSLLTASDAWVAPHPGLRRDGNSDLMAIAAYPLAEAVAGVFLAGRDLDWSAFAPDPTPHKVTLPTYPFDRKRYWFETAVKPQISATEQAGLYRPVWTRRTVGDTRSQLATRPWVLVGEGGPLWERIADRLRTRDAQVSHLKEISSDHLPPEGARLLLPCFGDSSFDDIASQAGRLVAGEWTGQLCLVSEGGCDVLGSETLNPARAQFAAFSHVVPQEAPGILAHLVDIGEAGHKDADGVIRLVSEDSVSPVAALRAGVAWVQDFLPEVTTPSETMLRREGVYLITGGFGRMSRSFARHLAKTYDARLVLVGRTIDPALIAELETTGSQVLGLSADLSQAGAMSAVMEKAQERFGVVHGVIHTAGVLDRDAQMLLTKYMGGRAETIRAAKVVAASELADLCHDGGAMDFCLLCSSLSTVLGGVGFATYAGANHHLDALADRQSRTNGPVLISVAWDGWDYEGQNPGTLSPRQGIALLERILMRGGPHRVIAAASPLSPRLDQFVTRLHRQREPVTCTTEAVRMDLSDLERIVADAWEHFLGLRPNRFDEDFFQLGGHSLAATQIVHDLGGKLGVSVTLAMALGHPTVSGLAKQIQQVLAAKTTSKKVEEEDEEEGFL
ncbi:amino acid adenylation domain-containing protein [Rhodospirillum sp. A1_3_36]|uniref:amino acid adenylation domain-containing protein n=1 Tax=Rhodospirillum sp. A1_3_36 TaxID=3391666 RepID=UPI0039A70F81